MNSEIICIAADSLPEEHSAFLTSYISKKLFELGHRTTFESFTAPDKTRVEALIGKALSRSDLVIILGGIEPETNSVAKLAVTSILGLPLVSNEDAVRSVREYCMSIGETPSAEQLSVAIMPEGAEVFRNALGLCCGFALEANSKKILLLPYAEGELTHMFEAYVTPEISPHGINVTHTVNVVGMNAEEIEQKLSRLQNRSEFAVGIEKHGAEFVVRVSVVAASKAEAESICSKATASVKFALGKAAYAINSKGIQYDTVALLLKKGLTVSTAESCTAGMVSEMLTDVGGSSGAFEYGISAYSNRIKNEILKVPLEILEKYSAISYETAKYMAINVRNIGRADLGVAITGNAGPAPSEGKPIGKVFIALADKSSYTVCELNLSDKLSRDEIREIASITALDLVRKYLLAYPENMSGMSYYSADLMKTDDAAAEKNETATESYFIPVAKDETPRAEPKPTEVTKAPLNDDFTPIILDREFDGDYDPDVDAEEYRFANKGRLSENFHTISSKLGGFFRSIFPHKEDGKKKILIKTGFITSLVAFVLIAALLFSQLTADNRQREMLSEAQQLWVFDGEMNDEGRFTAFDYLYNNNADVRAWIKIGGTKVNNPVYQSANNEFYLNHNMNQKKSGYGALFFDYRCGLDTNNMSQNLVIYGRNSKDGNMFGMLEKYKGLNFYKENPSFTLTQLQEQAEYKIFAVMVMNAKPEDDNGYMFNYVTPTFKTQAEFMKWVIEARERSIITTDIDIVSDDRIVTLVTSCKDFDDARFVVMARRTRSGESTEVNSATAILNPSPRYPKAWYDKMGLPAFGTENSSTESDTEGTDSIDESIPSSDDTGAADASSTEASSDSGSSTLSTGDTPSSVTSSAAVPSSPASGSESNPSEDTSSADNSETQTDSSTDSSSEELS